MEGFGSKPASEVLSAHLGGETAIGGGAVEVEAARQNDRARDASGV